MSRAPEITVCSVSFNSRPWLEMNHGFAQRLNPCVDLNWLVAENSPAQSLLSLSEADSRFEVWPGAAFEQRIYASGSYHHGRAMNMLLPHVKTRFALFCDPDFYIVKPGWVTESIAHMTSSDLAAFGVPWHPRWVYKNRYFPCVHCMFVDLERLPIEYLDFEPDYPGIPAHARDPDRSDGSTPKSKLPDPLKLRKRRHIGTSRDVGCRIAARLATEPHLRTECLQPVFRPQGQRLARCADWLLPDSLSLVPKRRGYFSETGFRAHGLPDLEGRGWEEFLWRGEPFGFHVRSQPKLKAEGSLDRHLEDVNEVLRAFLG
jgi:hypothetical protein